MLVPILWLIPGKKRIYSSNVELFLSPAFSLSPLPFLFQSATSDRLNFFCSGCVQRFLGWMRPEKALSTS
jgi:hypothetical protein